MNLLGNKKVISLKDNHREDAPSNKTSTYKKYEYVYLGNSYIKSTIYQRFLYQN